MQHIVFRVDANIHIATGHLMRCLTLAAKFQEIFPLIEITFVTRKLTQFAKKNIENTSYRLIEFAERPEEPFWDQTLDIAYSQKAIQEFDNIDLLIVDHYQLDSTWEIALSPCCTKLLVIDDLANRTHQCDFLLDQTLNRKHQDYLLLINPECHLLLGQKYMLLREEFSSVQQVAIEKRKSFSDINHILISLGGIDLNNDTTKLLDWLLAIPENRLWTITIVVSSDMPYLKQLTDKVAPFSHIELVTNCDKMSLQMLKADIAIGATGGTTWERCALGLPTIAVVLADNQKNIANTLDEQGAHINLGEISNIAFNDFEHAINTIKDPAIYQKMVHQCFISCDALGAGRAATRLSEQGVELILANSDDLDTVYQWQSNPIVRQYARNPEPVTYNEHKRWFTNSLSLDNRIIYIIYYANKPVGVLRLDKLDNTNIKADVETSGHTFKKEYEVNFEVSILIEPSAQGKGIALNALLGIPNKYNTQGIYAYVSPNNLASQSLFTKANFMRVGPDKFIRPATLSRKSC
jgi:UDP-2,4-diacetamido-2,4,6-trideoxy-beta-L-altropyranose hydrolase